MSTTSNTATYPKRWVFDKGDQGKADWLDGSPVDGQFVRFEQGRAGEYGQKPIAILEVDGVERSVWLLHDALYNRFRDELQRRSMPKLVLGERIVIEKHKEKTRSKNDRDYQGYDVYFPDAPAPSEEQLFKIDSASADESTLPTEESTPDEDIPF
jgi:hypothetical protein